MTFQSPTNPLLAALPSVATPMSKGKMAIPTNPKKLGSSREKRGIQGNEEDRGEENPRRILKKMEKYGEGNDPYQQDKQYDTQRLSHRIQHLTK